MNKKSLIAIFLMLVFLAPMTNASVFSEYDKAKAKLQKVDSKVTEARNSSETAQKQAEKKKAAKIASIQKSISAKQAEITKVKNDKTLFETERTLKLKMLNSELNMLKKQLASLTK